MSNRPSAFDPDFVVKTGAVESTDFKADDRETIKCSEILKRVRDDATPSYGIGLVEILRRFAEEELKFVRQKPFASALPTFSTQKTLFCASVFGSLSGDSQKIFSNLLKACPGFTAKECTLENYWEFLSPDNLFVERLGTMNLDPLRHSFRRGDCVFVMSAERPLDVLDYWNLRGLGWNVIPYCVESAHCAGLNAFVAKFIEENSYPLRGNPNIFNDTTLLKARSVSGDAFQRIAKPIVESLSPSKHPAEMKVGSQSWFTRIWDDWARDKDGAEPAELVVAEKDRDVVERDKRVSFKVLMPDFALRFGGHGQPRCANETELRLWGSEVLVAEAIPQGDGMLARAAGAFDGSKWRCAKTGLVNLVSHKNWTERFEIAPSGAVVTEWMRKRGWECTLSDKGKVANQMIKHLKGLGGIDILAKEGMVELLKELTGGRTLPKENFYGARSSNSFSVN